MLNSKKRSKKNQKYEKYWSTTMALTDFSGQQFIRTLAMIVEHIDKYKLDKYKISDLKSGNRTSPIVHRKELEEKIFRIYPNDSRDGASTRKQINEFIKLGFVKPFLNGYVPQAKRYINERISDSERKRLFSEVVYANASFDSSTVRDDTQNNQIKFLVNTLLNRRLEKKRLPIINFDELMGLMQLDIKNKKYANEKTILFQTNWAKKINFKDRKYNQINHLCSILRSMQFLTVKGSDKSIKISLVKDAEKYIPEMGDTNRDPYRFGLMKKAVYDESRRVYDDLVCWVTKKPSEGLVVSHIYPSAEALKNYDVEAAYDPNNAFLLSPGNVDQYFDKHKMTIDSEGNLVFSKDVRQEFINEVKENSYHIDKVILNDLRKKYLAIHNKTFHEKYEEIVK